MVYVILANGFEEIEAITIIDILRRGGVETQTVALTDNPVTGSHNIKVIADISIDTIEFNSMKMIVLPGGMPGATNLYNSDVLRQILKRADEYKKYIAAICAAPSVLGLHGLLKGVSSTCYPGFENKLEGAIVNDTDLIVDKHIITGKAAGLAIPFALKLVEIMKDEALSKDIADKIYYNR